MIEPTRKDRELTLAALYGRASYPTTMSTPEVERIERVERAIATARAEGYARAIAAAREAVRAEALRELAPLLVKGAALAHLAGKHDIAIEFKNALPAPPKETR